MGGKQIRMFLVDGTAGGLVTAEIVNWTGHVLKGTRDKLGEIRARGEAQRTGVYILLGDTDDGERIAYIGQSDDVAKRLHQHHGRKDFWTDVIVITSKDQNLTGAHVRYVEARLIHLANAIGRVPLENGNLPTGGAELPEADKSDMEYFIDQLRIILPVLGVEMFRGRPTRQTVGGAPLVTETEAGTPVDSPVFHLDQPTKGLRLQAQLIDGEFTVLQESVVAASMPDRDDYGSTSARQYQLRQAQHTQLVQSGAIHEVDGRARLTRDVVFSSPSAAGAVCLGIVSINGRTAWQTETGQAYGDWELEGEKGLGPHQASMERP